MSESPGASRASGETCAETSPDKVKWGDKLRQAVTGAEPASTSRETGDMCGVKLRQGGVGRQVGDKCGDKARLQAITRP